MLRDDAHPQIQILWTVVPRAVVAGWNVGGIVVGHSADPELCAINGGSVATSADEVLGIGSAM